MKRGSFVWLAHAKNARSSMLYREDGDFNTSNTPTCNSSRGKMLKIQADMV